MKFKFLRKALMPISFVKTPKVSLEKASQCLFHLRKFGVMPKSDVAKLLKSVYLSPQGLAFLNPPKHIFRVLIDFYVGAHIQYFFPENKVRAFLFQGWIRGEVSGMFSSTISSQSVKTSHRYLADPGNQSGVLCAQ